MSDTDRLNFLLRFLRIDDIGDEDFFPGVIVDQEKMEDGVGFGPPDAEGRRMSNVRGSLDDLRDVIDRAIASHSGPKSDVAGRLLEDAR